MNHTTMIASVPLVCVTIYNSLINININGNDINKYDISDIII